MTRRRFAWLWTLPIGLVAAAFTAGIVFWGGFNTAMEATNTLDFCITCHEMRDTVYAEYSKTVHYQNRTGVRATCADCHVPRPWLPKVVRKIEASAELYHKVMGSIATPEAFEAKRLELARRVWASMKKSDSRECRNCHSFGGMSKEAQKSTAWRRHQAAQRDGQTCIDCHQGIAHKDLSQFYEEESETE